MSQPGLPPPPGGDGRADDASRQPPGRHRAPGPPDRTPHGTGSLRRAAGSYEPRGSTEPDLDQTLQMRTSADRHRPGVAHGSVPPYLVPGGSQGTTWAPSVIDGGPRRQPYGQPAWPVPVPGHGLAPGLRPADHPSRPVPKSSTLAMVSLVAGVLWLGGLGSVVGIVTGVVALVLVAAGKAAGRGMAVGGIAAGMVTLGLGGVLLAGLLPVESPPQDVHAQSRAEAPPPLPVPVDPDSPYPVYGSQDMVRYLAQRMINHETDIDLRAYRLDDPAQAEDALLEAVIQNPYVIDVRTYGCRTDSCRIGYGYPQAEQAAIQRQVLDASAAILAETVDESMTDVEKVTAINGWLTKNARYDTEAAAILPPEQEEGFDVPQEYRYAWNASGVLLDGKGVCESYAEAFHLLANAAGVPVVTVSGYLLHGDAPHAWNKAYVGGRWKAVDVTWNDGPPTTTDYLLIDDSDFTGDAARYEDDQWMADALVPSYATS